MGTRDTERAATYVAGIRQENPALAEDKLHALERMLTLTSAELIDAADHIRQAVGSLTSGRVKVEYPGMAEHTLSVTQARKVVEMFEAAAHIVARWERKDAAL